LARAFPAITTMKDPPSDADDWKEVTDKLQHLER
jgi:hypothetical protein